MIRNLKYVEDGENVILGDRLEKGDMDLFSKMSNVVKPEGAKERCHSFLSVDPFPEHVWIAVAIKTYCSCGHQIQNGVCTYKNYKGYKIICDINKPVNYWYTIHGPFTERTEPKNSDYSKVTCHLLPVESPTTYDTDISVITNLSVDEFEQKTRESYNEYFESMTSKTHVKNPDIIPADLLNHVWFAKTSLQNRKEWCRRSMLKRLSHYHGLPRKQQEGLNAEEKTIVEELGGEKMTDELLKRVRENHPTKKFQISSGTGNLVAYHNWIDIRLLEGYVWEIEPHW